MSTAMVKRSAAWTAMAGAGVIAGFVATYATMMALAPVLTFATFVIAPAIALSVAVAVAARSYLCHCQAPLWAQRRRAAFWLGALPVMAYLCWVTTVDYYAFT